MTEEEIGPNDLENYSKNVVVKEQRMEVPKICLDCVKMDQNYLKKESCL